MTGRLEGKVAFVTGAARGQGRSHAIRMAQEGADIIAIDLMEEIPGAPYVGSTTEDLAETVRAVEALDRRIIASKADVRDFASLKTAVDDGVAQLGRLDIVAANAGISTQMARAEDIDEDIWEDTISTNLSGAWRTAKATIPHLKASGRGGAIIITSSNAGMHGVQNIAAYTSSKMGLLGLMRTLAVELAPDMIRVNTIHPTQVDTPMIMNEPTYRLFAPHLENATREDFAPASAALHALPVPWLDPIDISNAVLFLASDEARYITGVALSLNLG